MILRLLLALLLVLPAGLSAQQHQGCEPTVDIAAMDSDTGLNHENVSAEGHHASHGTSATAHEAAVPGDGCARCDLACKVSCAAVALPLGLQHPASAPGAAVVPDTVVAGLLNPHPLALLRPPARTPA